MANGTSKIVLTYLSKDILKRKVGELTASEILNRLVSESKARAVFYYCVITGKELDPVAVGTFPEEWLQIYARNGYIGVDPIVERAFTHKSPYVWSQMTGLTDAQRRFMEESVPYIGKQGVTIPLGTEHIVAGISVTSDDSDEAWLEKLPSLIWNASIAGHKIHTMVLQEKNAEDRVEPLTERQAEYLSLAASGLELIDIASVTKTSEGAVRRVMDQVQRKLKVNSHSQAVAKAATIGQISL